MKQETREERIKRMIEERNNGQTPVAPPVASPVSEPIVQDDDEARLISRENEQRIKDASKKSAEIAAQSAQVASKLAKQGWNKGLKAIDDLKAKSAARAEQKRVAQLQKDTEVEEEQRSVDASDAVSEEQHETLSASKPVRPRWLTPKLAIITVGLVIVGVGAAWFVRHQRNGEPTVQAPIAAEKTTEAPPVEVVQVVPIEAVLPKPAPVPPTELPPLPPATPTEQPAPAEVVVAPVAPKPIQRPQVIPVPKVAAKKSQPKPTPAHQEKEWQKDASKKLDKWGF
ncbi:hypothetical protein [Stenotrophomonas maltophilia]